MSRMAAQFKNLFFALFLLFFTSLSYALPFTITPAPGKPLPTQVTPGHTAFAFYTVTSLANVALPGVYVKYLPPNVKQILTDASIPNLCGSHFTLAAQGSCTLELQVTGTVNGQDPNALNHLFVCMQDGVMCAGTNFPLNVNGNPPPTSLTLTPTTIVFGRPTAITVTALYADGTTADASAQTIFTSINPAIATVIGDTITGTGVGNVTVSASFQGVTQATAYTVNRYLAIPGEYSSASVFYPLILDSANNGNSWNYSVTGLTPGVLPSPADAAGSVLATNYCSGAFCFAAGSSFSAGFATLYPYLIQTTNAGGTWSLAISPTSPALPSDYHNNGQLPASACANSFCMNAGSYSALSNNSYPLIAVSLQRGGSWSYAVSSTNVPSDYASTEVIKGGACSGNFCIAGGGYNSTNVLGQFPMMLRSTDGITWSYTVTSQLGTYPSDYTGFGVFYDISCHQNFCIGVGGYNAATGILNGPLVMQSSDGGVTWTTGASSSIWPADMVAGTTNSLMKASCSSSLCIGFGSYTSSSNAVVQQEVYQSQHGGAWSLIVSDQVGPTRPSYTTSVQQQGGTCFGNTCIVVANGIPLRGSINQFITLVTNDGGNTWSYTTTLSNPASPADFNGTIGMGGVYCLSALECYVPVNYHNTSAAQVSAVIKTTDGGNTWTYVANDTNPVPPSGTTAMSLGTMSSAPQPVDLFQQFKRSDVFGFAQGLSGMIH